MLLSIGDKVIIRQWDDMKNEYGYYSDCINVMYGFIDEMRKYCGMEMTISNIIGCEYEMIEDDGTYTYSIDMFEKDVLCDEELQW